MNSIMKAFLVCAVGTLVSCRNPALDFGSPNTATSDSAGGSIARQTGITSELVIPTGQHVVTRPLALESNQRVRCERGATLIASAGIGVFHVLGKQNVVIEDCRIVGQGARDGYSSPDESLVVVGDFNGQKSQRVWLSNLSIAEVRGQAGLKIFNSDDVFAQNILVDRYSYAGVQILGQSNNVTLSESYVRHSLARSAPHNYMGVPAPGGYAYGVQVSGHRFQNSVAFPDNVVVSGTVCMDNRTWDCFDAHGGTNLQFLGNSAIDSLKCFDLNSSETGDGPLKYVRVAGNTCVGTEVNVGPSSYSEGILVGGYNETAEPMVEAEYILIENNYIENAAKVKATKRAGINVQYAKNIVVRNNTLVDLGGMGISFASSVRNLAVTGNNIYDAAAVGIYLGPGASEPVNFDGNTVHSYSGSTHTGLSIHADNEDLVLRHGSERYCVRTPIRDGGADASPINLLSCD
ncbi:MAG: right-handed parallel beta-helix repeat-containing protein [Bdellovibrionales bacterium]|nr:right-handed parallel beta-helix repeat-containing protein [Bdellovibrionales bacterium]